MEPEKRSYLTKLNLAVQTQSGRKIVEKHRLKWMCGAGSIFLTLLIGCGGGGPPQREPARPATLTITDGNNQSGTVGAPLPQSLVVRVDDQRGQPLPGATVTWTVTSGGGSVDRASGATGSDGTASARWTLGTQVGTNALAATTGALAPVSLTATGTPGPVASIAITPPGVPLETGDVVQLGAAAADAYGNAVPPTSLLWSSSDTSVAKVTLDGFLAALAPGAVSISAGSGDVAGSLSLTISAGITFSFGPEETVFTWTTDNCEPLDVPDAPAHAVRLPDGTLVLIDGDAPRYYASFGADFSSLRRSCTQPALVSHDNYYPESYDNQEWLTSIYREGDVIHALIHNEYHDPFAPNCSPGDTSPGNPCWYNSITYAFSADSGHTFTHATPPGHVVAPPPVQWDPQGTPPPHGYFNPSNIVLGHDSFYYSIFMAIDLTGNQTLCVMRTQTLGDPTSWRAWDGTAFNLQMTSPYTGPAPADCSAVVSPSEVMSQPTLTYNTYIGKYLLVGSTIWGGPTEFVCGTGYSLSPDLINWTPRRLLRPANFLWIPACWSPDTAGTAYSSIVDHSDTTANFERSGQTPYLYYTRFNDHYLNRDLVRVPMIITAH